jgi:polar amino acid transport system substrate-binding protein
MRSPCAKRWRAFLLLAPLAAVIAACPALAQRIECVTEEMPPFQSMQAGTIAGYSTEVVKASLDRAALDHTLDMYPWARAYAMAKAKPNVLIYSILRTPERERMFQWAGQLACITVSFYRISSRNDVAPAVLEDAKRFKTVVIRDEAPHQYLLLQGFREGVNLLAVDSAAGQFKALELFPDVTLIALADATMPSRAREAGLAPESLTHLFELPGLSNELWAAFSAQTPGVVVERFSAALESLKREGFVDQAKARWGIR